MKTNDQTKEELLEKVRKENKQNILTSIAIGTVIICFIFLFIFLYYSE